MPTPDHIVIVVEENHDADQVIGNPSAPYINGTLVKNGLYYSNAHGTDHPSQPNYLEMFAGSNPGVQGVNSPLQQHYPAGMENTPAGQNALSHGDDFNAAQPFSVANLGSELLSSGYSSAGYSEDQPSVGFTGAQANGINGNRSYVEKHNAWAQFQGTGPNQLPASTNQPFTAFQSITDFSKLPTVSFVVPNEYNDMHDTVSKNGLYADPTKGKDASGNSLDKFGDPVNDAGTIQDGDTWLSNNIEAYRQWATTHNSLLITVWDENDYDFTNPNDIPLIVNGDPRLVQPGVNDAYVNHFDLLKTVENDYGLGLTGLAATADGLPQLSHPQYDFNYDGFSDLLWRSKSSGIFTEWQGKAGGFTPNTYGNGTVDNTWHIEGTADFNGDGRADILWRNDKGVFTEWQSNGSGLTPNVYGNGTVDTTWHVAGFGDFNGDGRSDIMWRNDNGTFTIWSSTGTGFTPNTYGNGSVDPTWHVQAIADFNGDGKDDILWRNNNGTFTVWSATGTGFTPNTYGDSSVDKTWHVAGTGDFNGDGHADILWRNDNGTFTEWQSNGTGFTKNVYGNSTVDPTWHVAEIADFNGDGKADILWRNDNGTFTTWSSTGNGFTPNTYVDASVSPDWQIQTHHYDLV